MCGIVGLYVKNNCDAVKQSVASVLVESKIRGLHSFGVAYYDSEKIVCNKYRNVQDLISNLTIHTRMIFHNRYSTSGDWRCEDNNQPIVSNGMAVCFNGVIDMRTKVEMEVAHGVKMSCENDAELAILKYDQLESLTTGKSFSGLFLKDGLLHHFRNKNRPAVMYEDENAIYIASTADIIRRAMGVEAKPTNVNKIWTA